MRYLKVLLIMFSVMLLALGCKKLLPPAPDSEETLAEPLEGLTGEQMRMHLLGDAEFARIFTQDDGLGPIFVQSSCESCHAADGKGNPLNNLTRFGRYNIDGTWNDLRSFGGPQLQNRSISGFTPESLPGDCAYSNFLAPSASGLGYLEAVPDASIISMADSADTDGDGISGRIHWVQAPAFVIPGPGSVSMNGKFIGRFGRKAMAVNLLHQTVGAYKQDMGITSPFDPQDPINHNVSTSTSDHNSDPEISAATVQHVAFYLRSLKAPPRRKPDDAQVKRGEEVFNRIGCEKCHRSTLTTGHSEITALNNAVFHPYSDMLLHDMGPELNDNYTEGTALTSEWRTMPLWGLGLQSGSQGGRIYLLHDGRASSYGDAIEYHGGEGSRSRDAFKALPEEEKQSLFKFLESL